jgi:serine/threonine-protein kinase
MAIEQLGRFKITGLLGKGAMGNVYRAYDPVLDREVAIKTVACAGLSPQEAEAFEQRFYREARSAGRLNHPNIVTIHDAGRDGDLAYIAMELLTGQTLREVLDSGVVMTPDRCAEIAGEIADGLAFAHANGVVHRDIKPANIMILDNGGIRIADFGVAQMPSSSMTLAGTAFGSPKYMSPEQIQGQKVDGRSDIFSLGILLYEMLTGRPPFDGVGLTAVLYQVLNGAPPLPSDLRAGLPRAFDRLVAKAMAKDPEKRYQQAADMAKDLRKCRHLLRQLPDGGKAESARVAQAPVSPLPSSPLPLPPESNEEPAEAKSQPLSGRKGWMAASAVALVVAALAMGIHWSSNDASTEPEPSVAAAAPIPAAVEPVNAPVPVDQSDEPEQPAAGLTSSGGDAVTKVSASTEAQSASKDGTLRLAISPWGEVRVDGKNVGVSPPMTGFKLSPGKHRVEIRNGGFPPFQQQIDVVAGQTVRIKHKFQ